MSFKISSHPFIFATAAGIALSGIGAYVWHEEARPAVLEVYIFSLKGSTAIFIRTPEDKRILMNGGANGDIIRAISGILPFYSRHIDAIIAAKDDADHVSGLIDVVTRYSATAAYIPAVTLESLALSSSTDPAYEAFVAALKLRDVQMSMIRSGDSIRVDSRTTLNVLFPNVSGSFVYSKASSPEVLLSLEYGSTSVFFMGTASRKIQTYVATTSVNMVSKGKIRMLVSDGSFLPGNFSSELISVLKPDFLVYSQAQPKGTVLPKSQKPLKSAKRKIPDPLSQVPSEYTFNLEETRVLKVVSDGTTIRVEKY